jgi:N-acyl-phosphatidylethanolamine-hydrolysing phospholipase D
MKDSHLNPSEAIQTAIDLNAGKAIGMHWGTFILTDEPVKDPPRILNLELQNRGLDNLFIIPKPGEIISLE